MLPVSWWNGEFVQVLKVVSVHRESLKADSLQQLHAMHNLSSLMGTSDRLPPGVMPTLRDESLQKDADSIREVWSMLEPCKAFSDVDSDNPCLGKIQLLELYCKPINSHIDAF